jgi:hypothetical protein
MNRLCGLPFRWPDQTWKSRPSGIVSTVPSMEKSFCVASLALNVYGPIGSEPWLSSTYIRCFERSELLSCAV